MPVPVPYTDLALKSEITTDPAAIGYAAPLAAHDLAGIANRLNAQNYTAYQPAPTASVLKWGAATGVRLNIELAATKAAPFTSITPAQQCIALAVRDLLQGGYDSLKVNDPAIAGAQQDGTPYVPGGPATANGMLDALVAAGIMTAAQKDSLISLGATPASRVQVLFGTTAPTIDADRVGAALRS